MKDDGAKVFFHFVASIYPAPALTAVFASVKAVTRRDEKDIRIVRRNPDHMTILIDTGYTANRPKGLRLAFTHVTPTFSRVEALDDSALFNGTIHYLRVLGMNGDPFDVGDVRWRRIAPFASSREFAHAV